MRHYTRLALTAAALLAAGSLTACSADSATSTPKEDSSSVSAPAAGAAAAEKKESDAAADVKITKSGFEDHEVWGPKAYVVYYTITNSSPAAADYFVGLEFLDKDGDVLGSTGVGADKLGPGKTKTDSSAPLDAEIENGKIADIDSVRVAEVSRTAVAQ